MAKRQASLTKKLVQNVNFSYSETCLTTKLIIVGMLFMFYSEHGSKMFSPPSSSMLFLPP